MRSKKRRTTLIMARKRKGETQRAASANLGISEVYLRKIEAGDANPGRDTMIKMGNYYNESIRALFKDLFLPVCDTNVVNK